MVDMPENDVMCMSPWTHMHGLPNGDVVACCLSPTTEVLGNLKNESLMEIWNGTRMRELRRNMLEGKPSNDICGRCYLKENHGLSSLRTGMNDRFSKKYADLVTGTSEDGTVSKLNLVHWDFRFSNICNLRCRSCGPGFSSNWYDDHIKLYFSNNPDSENNFRKTTPRLERMVNANTFWDLVEPLIGEVESIHFAGGEPLIMDEHWRIMDRLIAAGNFEIHLHYSTNFTQMTYRGRNAFEVWKPFKNIMLSLSIDGTEKQFDYLRKGASWSTVVENFTRLKDERHIRKFIHPTVSAFNVLSVLDLHRISLEEEWIIPGWCDAVNKPNTSRDDHYKSEFLINNLIMPDFYSVQILPDFAKDMVEDKITQHARWAHLNYGVPLDGWDGLISYMREEDKSHLIPEFRRITEKLDSIRGEDFSIIFPEWKGIL